MFEVLITILPLTIVWIAYAILSAITEGHYQDYLFFSDRKHRNLHPFYVVERGIVLAFMWLQLYDYSPWNKFIFIVGLCFIYSAIHDGCLYATRNKLNPNIYKKKWFANKEEGYDKNSAIIELSVAWRIAMAFMGFLFILGVILDSIV